MQLSERDREVYSAVRDAAKEGRRATLDEVAGLTGHARSTVAQVAKRLGYDGWADLTTKLLSHYRELPSSGDAISECVSSVASMIGGPSKKLLLVDAVGDAEICVEYVVSRFGARGFHAMPYGFAAAGLADWHQDAGTLIVINESGMALLPSCLQALEMGCKVVSITASHDTPVSKFSSVNVVIKNDKSDLPDYRPNFFTAGVLIFLEKVLAAVDGGADPERDRQDWPPGLL